MIVGWQRGIAVTIALVAWTSAAGAQAAGSAPITRADLAAAYMRLDRVLSPMPLPDSTRAAVNRAFDRSTLSFFGGKFLAAITTIDSLTTAISGVAIPSASPPPPRTVNGKPPSAARDALLARIAKMDSTGARAQAWVSARARASLLVDTPSPERSAEFLANPATLATAVTTEVRALEQGRDPYAASVGDLWRAFRGANGSIVPFRVVAAKNVASSKSPVPLLIVLHGAGGDENMFVDAYGAGITPQLASERGMLLVSPATTAFSTSPENFDAMLSLLRAEYNIDAGRVYVLGHSMGAGAAAKLTSQRPAAIAAAACLSGGAAVKVDGAPPMLFVGAQLDPIIPARVVRTAAEGTPTATYRELPNEGHTLMVSNGVRLAVPWLLEHHR